VKDFGDVTYEQIDGLIVENMTALGHIAACQKEVNMFGQNIWGEGEKQNNNVCKIFTYRFVFQYRLGLICFDTSFGKAS
jgi:hypothetical protein